MKRLMLLAATCGMLWLGTSSALAEETDQCENSCPDGQKLAGFADGNHATCFCVDASAGMEDTVEASAESPSASDGEPMPGDAPDPTVVEE